MAIQHMSLHTAEQLLIGFAETNPALAIALERVHGRDFHEAPRPEPEPLRQRLGGVRVNTSGSGQPGEEHWSRRALVRASDLPSAPESQECERGTDDEERGWRSCSKRYPCPTCYAWSEWDEAVLDVVREATGWGLFGSGEGCEGCPGRPYLETPHPYVHRRHPGVVVVSWGGGLDI